MNNIEKILELAKQNNGFISSQQVKSIGLTTKYLTTLNNEKLIEKIKAGLYFCADHTPDQFYEILYNTPGIYSHTTALYFHNLIDRTPINFDITVANDYKGSLQNDEKVNLFYVKKTLFNIGMTEIKSPQGSIVKTYDMERTICDIIRNEKKIDLELFVAALQNYVRQQNKRLNILTKYAQQFAIQDKVMANIRILL